MKADVVVFRDQSGRACVRPSVFVVEFKNNQNAFTIRNDTDKPAQIAIPHDGGIISDTLTLRAVGGGNHKKTIDVTRIIQNQSSVIHYHVYLGAEEAQGESAPALIIDD